MNHPLFSRVPPLGRCLGGIVVLLLLGNAPGVQAASFTVTYSPQVTAGPFTGRVYILLQSVNEPVRRNRLEVDWFTPRPFFSGDVTGWQPGQPLLFDAHANSFLEPLSPTYPPPGRYYAQAFMDFDQGAREVTWAADNGFSQLVTLDVGPRESGPLPLVIDQRVADHPFPQSARLRLFEMPSRLLSEFHGRPITLRAGVVLPAEALPPTGQRFPVVYEIPGFGGDHFTAAQALRQEKTNLAGVPVIYVVLDPDCRLGHHVFADSANNGPYGQALIEEFIPKLEATFPAWATPAMRLLTGHSSGGWSSLYLQITYPDFFNGTWSTAPDPVDFHDFQGIDLYQAGQNYFWDARGQARPLARRNGQPFLYNKHFSAMEEVLGRGGQLASFEAVFSPRLPNGRPRKLWDRQTGAIDPETVRAWATFDISKLLRQNWNVLAPKLAGKIHIYMGADDTFYLEGATLRLKQRLAQLGSDAVVEIVPGRDHFSLLDPSMKQHIARSMAQRLQNR